MSITQLTRFKSNNAEEMIKAAKEAKKLFEKHGAEWLRLSRFHSGEFTGQWLGASRYSSWEVYGKAQEGLVKEPEFAKLMANMTTFSELTGRNITVGIDLCHRRDGSRSQMSRLRDVARQLFFLPSDVLKNADCLCLVMPESPT